MDGGKFVISGLFERWFSWFLLGRNIGFYGVFVHCLCLTGLRKSVENLASSSVFVDHVVENVANYGVFDSGLKNTVKRSVLSNGKLKNIAICSGFCIAMHKNTVEVQQNVQF